jgi:glycosyltransferase involved in cell wall biosynthesis
MKNFRKNIAVDASNIVSGGGFVHLYNFLEYYKKSYHKKFNLYVFCNFYIFNKIKNKSIIKINIGKLPSDNIFFRFLWLFFKLPKQLKIYSCSTLFSPGGLVFNRNIKTILMFRNLQPFQLQRNTLYGVSLKSVRVLLKRMFFLISLRTANKVIFLSINAYKVCKKKIKKNFKKIIIYHGVIFKKNFSFQNKYLYKKKISFIYLSSLEVYKNHINLINAFNELKKDFNLNLTIIGNTTDQKTYEKISNHVKKINQENKFIFIKTNISHDETIKLLSRFDFGIQASSCENFPHTLIEMLSNGLPVITSGIPVMKEVLGGNYIFFNEQNTADIVRVVSDFLQNKKYVDYLNKRRKFFIKNFNLRDQQKKLYNLLAS